MSSRDRFATPAGSPRHECSPYRGLHARRESLGFVHRPRAIFCRARAKPCVTILVFCVSLQVTFFMRKGADVLSKWVGEAERQVRFRRDFPTGDLGYRGIRRVDTGSLYKRTLPPAQVGWGVIVYSKAL
jgi:hypothetical protein